ncbi:SDR family NAD(P)-dependent oxidoreductase [Thioalkalivibrio sp. HK1]|uniref:SDR family NAD(P)-dependent oxidoreductase n=1 Tax=Thioalkalivibrio sp. HK1 TaxID=1469245 RepID=UPI00047164DD|nr:SDR family NAD(P)-dependent oxidoreductase [Thioalkalivibrio sp. HK1]
MSAQSQEPDPQSRLFDLQGRIALVTGASSGLGRHFAKTLAAHGAKVALAARRFDRIESLARNIHKTGGVAHPVRMDVTSHESVERALDAVQSALGAPDILINNSGIARTAPAFEMREEDWSAVIDTNLSGAWRVARQTAQRMVKSGHPGAIVNILSILAFGVAGNLGAYAASKAGLLQLTRTMAMELARHRIRVNAIAPGYVRTDMNRDYFASEAGKSMIRRIPQRRIADPAELDGALLLLASDASSYMTGSTIVVDGGHLAAGL